MYEPPPTTGYVAPPLVSNTAGDFFWREQGSTPALVAVRDGRPRWRRPLGAKAWPGLFTLALLRDDLLVAAFGSTIEARRTSDGRLVWSRDLRADLARELRRAGLAKNTELETSAAARVGGALVTASAASATDAWLTATTSDGTVLWRTHIDGPAARMAADGERLYLLYGMSSGSRPAVIAVDSNGTVVPDARVPFNMDMAVRGGDVVFDDERVVAASIAPLPRTCPTNSPSCLPQPFMLTVSGFAAGQERWHLTHPPGGTLAQLLLLSDGSVLLVDDKRVGHLSGDGNLTQVCELPVVRHRSVAGLVNGDLVVAYHDSVAAYTLPGAPQLAATGWVTSGGGPAQDWAPRASVSAAAFIRFPAGVADPHANVAYVQTDAGLTTALALADGTVRWRTRFPARPVGMWHGRVIVLAQRDTLASVLQVAQLDPTSGTEVATSQSIPLPNWVASPLEPWGKPFWSGVRIEGDRAHVSWEIMINGGSGGATIRPYGDSGSADIDLTNGAVSLSPTKRLDEARPIPSSQGPLSAVVADRRFTLSYAATATLTATDVTSGKRAWTRQLWSIAEPLRVRAAP